MIELTEQQRQVLHQTNGHEVHVCDPDTQKEYVLVSVEVYLRLKGLLQDDSDWTPEEQLQLLAESGKRAGWDDPAMDVYDQYQENRKKLCQ
jgi:hypothetical protein